MISVVLMNTMNTIYILDITFRWAQQVFHAGTVGRSSGQSSKMFESSSTLALISSIPVSALKFLFVTRMPENGTSSTSFSSA